jgi:hypothetical protein
MLGESVVCTLGEERTYLARLLQHEQAVQTLSSRALLILTNRYVRSGFKQAWHSETIEWREFLSQVEQDLSVRT